MDCGLLRPNAPPGGLRNVKGVFQPPRDEIVERLAQMSRCLRPSGPVADHTRKLFDAHKEVPLNGFLLVSHSRW